jgi:hypothetical protein
MEVDNLKFGQTSPHVSSVLSVYIIFLRRYGLRGWGELRYHVDAGLNRRCNAHNNDSPTFFGSLEGLIALIASIGQRLPILHHGKRPRYHVSTFAAYIDRHAAGS